MAEELNNDQIAMLCDIGEWDPSKLSTEQAKNLNRLRADGYLEDGEVRGKAALKLTPKAVEYLGQRGAGLNES